MKSLITKTIDWFFGRGEYGVTVPAMDGALRPNDALDRARTLLKYDEIDNVASCGEKIYFSSREMLLALVPGDERPEVIKEFAHVITAIAISQAGRLAVALGNGQIVRIDAAGSERHYAAAQKGVLKCLTAMAFQDERTLLLCNGASDLNADRWVHDLMSLGASGSVWALDCENDKLSGLAADLAWPNGVIVKNGRIYVSEAWRHRILEIGSGKSNSVLLDLPGYPARMTPTENGVLLCVFAPRSQLVEFVLRERSYCDRMIREVPPAFWIAPALFSGRSYLEPLQGGSVKQLGILKPWSPTRSYGLAIELDSALQPVRSYHSRADGTFHGITSVATYREKVLVTSRGANALLEL
jgi:hypothetical protein